MISSLGIFCFVLFIGLFVIQESFAEIHEEQQSDIDDLEIEFIHLGDKGESILIKSNEKYVLIDGGKPQAYAKVKQSLKNMIDFEHKEGNRLIIDFVMATHKDVDHTGGIEQLLNDDDFKIKHLWLTKHQGLDDPSKDYPEIWKSIENVDSYLLLDTLTKIPADIKNEFPIPVFSILSPPENGIKKHESCLYDPDANDNSLVISFQFANHSLLFGGDATCNTEHFLLDSNTIESLKDNVLVMNTFHHGVDDSSSREFLEHIQPKVSVTSRIDDRYPTEETKAVFKEMKTHLLSTSTESVFILINTNSCKYANERILPTTNVTYCNEGNEIISERLPPIKQMLMKIPLKEISCNENFILLIKTSNNNPACVTIDTSEKLIQRGWGASPTP